MSDEVVCTIDLPTSIAALTRTAIPADAYLDSFDVSAALLGQPGAKGREHLIQQDNGQAGNYGFRVGNWKLQRHDSKITRNLVVEEQLANTPVPQFQLFDLTKDPAEKNNVIAQNAEVGERLKAQLAHLIAAGRSRPGSAP